jgi:hypothetical protein
MEKDQKKVICLQQIITANNCQDSLCPGHDMNQVLQNRKLLFELTCSVALTVVTATENIEQQVLLFLLWWQ